MDYLTSLMVFPKVETAFWRTFLHTAKTHDSPSQMKGKWAVVSVAKKGQRALQSMFHHCVAKVAEKEVVEV